MKNFSIFQIGVYSICAIGVVIAMLIFTGTIPIGSSTGTASLSGNLTMWGTIPYEDAINITNLVSQTYKNVTVSYKYENPSSFHNDLVNALAAGNGPDLITVSSSDVMQDKPVLLEMPFSSVPQSTYQSTFVDQADQYLTNTGVLAFPLVIDPMIMYYNRDILTSAFVTNPPTTWDDVVALNKKVTQKDDAGGLSLETIALGTFDNIAHAKEIIAMLIFQAGNPIVKFDSVTKKYVSTFSDNSNGNSGVTNAVTFYTGFANPTDTDHYSWNESLTNNLNQFISGNLAIYLGFASELQKIRTKNPNLNFSVAMIPERAKGSFKAVYGTMTGVGIIKSSKNIAADVAVAQLFAQQASISALISLNPSYTPARKDMLADVSTDTVQTTINRSAIISRSFLDPDPVQTSAFFKNYIGQINAGVIIPEAILTPGNSLLTGILDSIQKQVSGN